jgi:hypothetical protein
LIGIRIGNSQAPVEQHLWADEVRDESIIWNDFIEILSGIDRPVLLHYGSYEKTFLQKMCRRYGAPHEGSPVVRSCAPSISCRSFTLVCTSPLIRMD